MGEMSVYQIVERCQLGDEQAFGLLYTVMRDRLRTVCRNYTANEQTVDDLLHDSFVLILSKINTLKDLNKAEAWMTAVTRNVAQSWLNHQQQEEVVSLDAMEQPLQVEEPVPVPVTYDEILHLVDALPRRYRRVFRLSVLEGMNHQQIAALLNIEPHTSSAQLSRAKLLLRHWLGPMVLLFVAALLPLGVWWYSKPTATDREPLCGTGTDGTAKHSPATRVNDSSRVVAAVILPADTAVVPPTDTATVSPPTDTATVSPSADTASVAPPSVVPYRVTELPVDRQTADHPAPRRDSQWSVDLAYSGIGSNRDLQLPYANAETNDAVYDSETRHRMPLTIGLTVNRRLTQHWQVGLGIQYTRMTTDSEWGNTYTRMVKEQRVNYLGLPLSVQWHYPLVSRLSLYTAANVTLQLPLRSTADSRCVLNGLTVESSTERLHPGIQWSAGLGLGLHYSLTPAVGFFVEPSLQHYFRNSSGVETWQTEHPAAFSVPFGLRIIF